MSNNNGMIAGHGTTAKDFFLHLAFIVTLVWLVTGFFLGSFSLIDSWLPDTLSNDFWYGSSVSPALQGALASLVIVTPFFLVIAGFINRELRQVPEKKNMWVRKWMLYALLFLSFIVTVTDLVILSNSFFQGELTSRFALKTVVVLAVAAFVFSYFLYELKREVETKSRVPMLSGVVTSILVFALIVTGFVTAGSPTEQRARKLDNERVNSLEQMSWEIEGYIRDNKELPESISDLDFINDNWQDPLTGEAYTYRVKDQDSFELCANFALATKNNQKRGAYAPAKEFLIGPQNFDHPAGESCFSYRVRDWNELDHRSRKASPDIAVPQSAE